LKAEDILAGCGPLSSRWGLKTWRLLLGRHEIVACPYSSRECWRLGWAIETGLVSRPEIAPVDLSELQELVLRPESRTYRLSEVTFITLRNRMARNSIEIGRLGGAVDSYGICDRGETDSYRTLLRSSYQTQYKEAGFPQSLLGKVLKF
jgi:hypothetical protein